MDVRILTTAFAILLVSGVTLIAFSPIAKSTSLSPNDKILRVPEKVSAFESALVYANVTGKPSEVSLNGTIKIHAPPLSLHINISLPMVRISNTTYIAAVPGLPSGIYKSVSRTFPSGEKDVEIHSKVNLTLLINGEKRAYGNYVVSPGGELNILPLAFAFDPNNYTFSPKGYAMGDEKEYNLLLLAFDDKGINKRVF